LVLHDETKIQYDEFQKHLYAADELSRILFAMIKKLETKL